MTRFRFQTRSLTLRHALGACGLFALLAATSTAEAADIVVNTNAMNAVGTDGKCTLTEAVTALNNRTRSGSAAGECVAGDGLSDTITLMASTQTYSTNNTLEIHRSVQINGAVGATSTLKTGGIYGIQVTDTLHVNPTVYVLNLTVDNLRTDALPVWGIGLTGSSDPADIPKLSLYQVTVKNCTIGIRATAPRSTGASISADRVTVSNSKAAGVSNEGSTVTLSNSLVTGSKDSGIRAVGIPNGVNMTIDRTTVDANSGTNGGGIYVDGDIPGFLTVTKSTISNNTATADGGGIFDNGHVTVRESTISGNKAARGAGLFHQSSGECYFYGSTFAFNAATTAGGGIYSMGGTFAAVVGSLVAKNTAPTGPDCTGAATPGSLHVNVGGSSSFLGNSSGCPSLSGVFNIQNQDPLLGALSANSYSGLSYPKIHPLLKGSPAIDGLTSGASADERGYQRPEAITKSDGTLLTGTAWDYGAYEYNTVWPAAILAKPASSGDSQDFFGSFVTYGADAVGDYITFAVPIYQTGTFTVTAGVQKWNQGGKYQLQTADTLAGPYTAAGSQDLWKASTTSVQSSFGTATFTTVGIKYFRFQVTGKNSSSLGYQLYIGNIKTVN